MDSRIHYSPVLFHAQPPIHLHVVQAKETAITLLANNVETLLKKSTVTDAIKNNIVGTPLQIALGAHDCDMVRAIINLFTKLPGANPYQLAYQQANEQYSLQQFSNNQDNIYDFSVYVDDLLEGCFDYFLLFEEIPKTNIINRTADSAEQVRKPQTITHGDHFNLGILINALQEPRVKELPTDLKQKYWQYIILYLAKHLPVNYLQTFWQTFDKSAANTKINRHLNFAWDAMYVLDKPGFVLGFNHEKFKNDSYVYTPRRTEITINECAKLLKIINDAKITAISRRISHLQKLAQAPAPENMGNKSTLSR